MSKFAFLVALVVAVVSAQMTFPGQQWERRTPAQAGFNAGRLNAAMDYGGSWISGSFCLSVHRDGFLVAERYLQGYTAADPEIMWSTAKAVVSTLIGIAERRGQLRTEDPASRYIREFANTPAAGVTVDNLLRHDSGRYYDLINDFVIPQFLNDQTAFGMALQQTVAPGTRNQYNQMAFQLLQLVLQRATGETVQTYSERELFVPLGFAHRRFWLMNSVILNVPQVNPLVYGGLYATCTDLARVAHLWLNNGMWRGNQILTPSFVTKALTPQQRPYGNSRRYHWGGPPNHGAVGLGNQFMSFNVGNGIVMTRIGDPLSPGFQIGTFTNQVIGALAVEFSNTTAVEQDPADLRMEPEEEQAQAIFRELFFMKNASEAAILKRATELAEELGYRKPVHTSHSFN